MVANFTYFTLEGREGWNCSSKWEYSSIFITSLFLFFCFFFLLAISSFLLNLTPTVCASFSSFLCQITCYFFRFYCRMKYFFTRFILDFLSFVFSFVKISIVVIYFYFLLQILAFFFFKFLTTCRGSWEYFKCICDRALRIPSQNGLFWVWPTTLSEDKAPVLHLVECVESFPCN